MVVPSVLILASGLEADQFSSDRAIAGYFVVACLALFAGVGSCVM